MALAPIVRRGTVEKLSQFGALARKAGFTVVYQDVIIGPVLAGLFLTSLDIFTATFGRELRAGAASAPTLLENDVAKEELRRRGAE